MEEYEENMYMFEGGVRDMIDIEDIEEILMDRPKTRKQPNPAQIDSSQLVKVAYKTN